MINRLVCPLKCLVTGAVLLVATGGGIPIGYSAVLLPQLSEDSNSTLYVDRETGSWIGKIARLIILIIFNKELWCQGIFLRNFHEVGISNLARVNFSEFSSCFRKDS